MSSSGARARRLLWPLLTAVLTTTAAWPSGAPDAAPTFTRAPCETAALPHGREVTCGRVRVPERHDLRGGRTIELNVMVVRASRGPANVPVLYLHGGPGGNTAGFLEALRDPDLRTFAADRDLVLLDQRGGASPPDWRCWSSLTPEQRVRRALRPPGDRAANEVAEARRCRAQLARRGMDLTALTTAQGAADVEAVRRALNLREVHLYGISYGARLAQEVARRFPRGVRSVVLDGPLPSGAGATRSSARLIDRALSALFARCAADVACRAAHPDPRARLAAALRRLEVDPPRAPLLDGTSAPLTVAAFAQVLLVDVLPSERALDFIEAAADGRWSWLQGRLMSVYGARPWWTGVMFGVGCADGFLPRGEGGARLGAPAFARALDPLDDATATVCQDWYDAATDPTLREPARSSIPTLILSGALDPVTPPQYGERVAAFFDRSTLVTFPGGGHGQVWPGPTASCAVRVVHQFWARPGRAVNAACAETVGRPIHR